MLVVFPRANPQQTNPRIGLHGFMMTSSKGNIPALPVTGEFLTQRPVTRSIDIFFDLCVNK